MTVKLLTEHHLEILRLIKGDCTDSSKSKLVKVLHYWKSHVTTHIREQKYLNIAHVLQDELFTTFFRPANACTCPLKAYAIKNISE